MQVSFRSMMVLSSWLTIALPFIASAQTPQGRIRASLTPKLNNGAAIDEITQSPLPDLFDVRVGRDVMYGDETGIFILQGNLINLQTGQNLTRERADLARKMGVRPMLAMFFASDSKVEGYLPANDLETRLAAVIATF